MWGWDMDKVQLRALGFAVWVILALIVTLLLDSYEPRLRGLGGALCLPLMVPIVLMEWRKRQP
jgi:hypothetical protein